MVTSFWGELCKRTMICKRANGGGGRKIISQEKILSF